MNDFGKLQERRNSILKGFTDEDIEKAKSGTYADTAQNRKLGRVGQKFGGGGEKQSNVTDEVVTNAAKLAGITTKKFKTLKPDTQKALIRQYREHSKIGRRKNKK